MLISARFWHYHITYFMDFDVYITYGISYITKWVKLKFFNLMGKNDKLFLGLLIDLSIRGGMKNSDRAGMARFYFRTILARLNILTSLRGEERSSFS